MAASRSEALADMRATYQDVLDAPAHQVAEIVNGTLYAHPRPAPAPAHTLARSALGTDLGNPFQFGRGGPGGWWILDEPELHLDDDILVPDAGPPARAPCAAVCPPPPAPGRPPATLPSPALGYDEDQRAYARAGFPIPATSSTTSRSHRPFVSGEPHRSVAPDVRSTPAATTWSTSVESQYTGGGLWRTGKPRFAAASAASRAVRAWQAGTFGTPAAASMSRGRVR